MPNFKELERLNLPTYKFAVFGSGPMAVRGLRKLNDIDVIAKSDLWEELALKHGIDNKEKGLIKIGEIEIFKSWTKLDVFVDELIDIADLFNGIRFVKLKYVLEWKRNMGRPKDLEDIKLIEDYLEGENV